MDYIHLGTTGLQVSRLCLGTMSYGKHESRPWALGETETEPFVHAAAERRDAAPAQLALAWLPHKPRVTAPIIGATKLHHLEDAIAAEQLELDGDEVEQLEAGYRSHDVAGLTTPRQTRRVLAAGGR